MDTFDTRGWRKCDNINVLIVILAIEESLRDICFLVLCFSHLSRDK